MLPEVRPDFPKITTREMRQLLKNVLDRPEVETGAEIPVKANVLAQILIAAIYEDQRLGDMTNALAPFAIIGAKIPSHWKREVPLKAQTNAPKLPLVSDYLRAAEVMRMKPSR